MTGMRLSMMMRKMMTATELLSGALPAFLACAVECVEALTVVLAVGVTRGWSRALGGAACAVAILAVALLLLGPAIVYIVALPLVRGGVGLVALYIGQKWLRKAILRASGRKALRDEAAAFANDRARLERGEGAAAFATAFSGTLLEGIEVIAIVLALGAGGGAALAASSVGAAAAVIVVLIAGIIARAPLSRVPENALKFVVGILLSAFGIFWAGEGVGVKWPGDDLALLGLAVLVAIVAFVSTAILRGARASRGSA